MLNPLRKRNLTIEHTTQASRLIFQRGNLLT
jgi:hypothetical protein